MVKFSNYSKIYIKGYQDTNPINIRLMFQLSFCKMVRGGIREQLRWFISGTDTHWKEQEWGLPPCIPLIQNSLSPVLWSELRTPTRDPHPPIRHTDLCRCSDLNLSKGLAAAPTSLWPTTAIHDPLLKVHHGISWQPTTWLTQQSNIPRCSDVLVK